MVNQAANESQEISLPACGHDALFHLAWLPRYFQGKQFEYPLHEIKVKWVWNSNIACS